MINKKIPLIMNEIGAIKKSEKNRQQGFNFRSIDQVYNQLHPILAKHEVFTIPEIIEIERGTRQTNKGGVINWVSVKMNYHFTSSDGSAVTASVSGEAMDTADKATSKAMAIAHKYALLQIFCIPTEEEKDPDYRYTEAAPVRNGFKWGKLFEENNWSPDDAKSYIRLKFGVLSSHDLSEHEKSALIKDIKTMDFKTAKLMIEDKNDQ